METGLAIGDPGLVGLETDADFRAILGVGATYSLTDNMTFDVGVNVGLTDHTPDFNLFSGITVRF